LTTATLQGSTVIGWAQSGTTIHQLVARSDQVDGPSDDEESMDDLNIRIMIAIAAGLTVLGNIARGLADAQIHWKARDSDGKQLNLKERAWRDIVKAVGYGLSIAAGLLALGGAIFLIP
jgi:hypothetical protein